MYSAGIAMAMGFAFCEFDDFMNTTILGREYGHTPVRNIDGRSNNATNAIRRSRFPLDSFQHAQSRAQKPYHLDTGQSLHSPSA